MGPYASGDECFISHIWKQPAYYEIKVKAKDQYDESDWSNSQDVNINWNQVWLFGRIENPRYEQDLILFNATSLKHLSLKPFEFNKYTNGEEFIVNKDYKGFIGTQFIFGKFAIIIFPN